MSTTSRFWVEEYRNKAAAPDPITQSGRSDQFDLPQVLHVVRQMLRLLAVRPVHDVLDVGCANGLVDIVLGGCCRSVLAIEPVEELAALARKNLSACPNVTVEIARSDSIPSADGRFDRALVLEVIQLLPPDEAQRMFRELRRVIRPAGRIVIGSVPDARRRDQFLVPYLKEVREATHLTDEQKQAIIARNENAYWYDAEDLMAWWRELGGEPRVLAPSDGDPANDQRYHVVVDILV